MMTLTETFAKVVDRLSAKLDCWSWIPNKPPAYAIFDAKSSFDLLMSNFMLLKACSTHNF